MKINRVKLFNYRCFKELELELNDSFTILVGNNGSGKSTVWTVFLLDWRAILLA